MDVMYATDKNYVTMCGVSMYSLLKNNQDENIHIYIFGQDIEEEKTKFLSLEEQFDVQITFIDMLEIKETCIDMGIPPFRGSYMAYARLFAERYIGKRRVLYLDCDTLVVSSLKELWNMDLEDYVAAAVLDCIHSLANQFIQKSPNSNYFNSGVILFNFSEWKKNNCIEKIIYSLKHINISETATYGDQDILNHAIGDKFCILPPKYNAMYITRYFSSEKNYIILRKNKNSYYKKDIINNSRKNIVIKHFSGRDLLRPWFLNNALSINENKQWENYLSESPWQDYKKKTGIDNRLRAQFVHFYLEKTPAVFCYMHGLLKEVTLKNRLYRITKVGEKNEKDFHGS